MKEHPLISVIVPAYNVAEYLGECVDSILAQTYKNLEVILVDDGSNDGKTPNLCDELAKRDSRIKVIHKQNGGISSARNVGIDASTGDYFYLIDSDDYLYDCKVIEELFDEMSNKGCDFVMGNMIRSDMSPDQKNIIPIDFVRKLLDSMSFFKNVIRFSYTSVPILYKKASVFCRFDETLKYFEDGDFLFHLFTRNSRCSYISNTVYVYRKHSNSLTTSINPQTIEAFKRVAINVGDYSKLCYSSQMSKYYLQCSVMLYFWMLDKLCDRRYYKNRFEYIKLYRLDSFRRRTLVKMLRLKQINKSIIYVVLPLRLATLIHPIVD